MNGKWVRCSKRNPCPICHRPDWCGVSEDGQIAHCMRIHSDRACRKGGWFHRLSDPKPVAKPRPWHKTPPEATIDVAERMAGWLERTRDEQRQQLAANLGVTFEAIASLSAGWAIEHSAWAFPMSDGDGRWIGIRLRNSEGKKWAVRGSKSGLFLPFSFSHEGPLIIVEGPTDTAAVLTWEFDAIGRPSCNDGGDHIVRLLQALRHAGRKRDVVILGNLDEEKTAPDGRRFYPGQDGAVALADQIIWHCKSLRVVFPPPGVGKDARTWLRAGGTRRDLEELIAAKGQWKTTRTQS